MVPNFLSGIARVAAPVLKDSLIAGGLSAVSKMFGEKKNNFAADAANAAKNSLKKHYMFNTSAGGPSNSALQDFLGNTAQAGLNRLMGYKETSSNRDLKRKYNQIASQMKDQRVMQLANQMGRDTDMNQRMDDLKELEELTGTKPKFKKAKLTNMKNSQPNTGYDVYDTGNMFNETQDVSPLTDFLRKR
jgi:ERCC4-related helicase